MVSGTAISISGTVTWIFTLLISACKMVRAIRISQTLIWSTIPIWISFVIFQAITISPVIFWLANCIHPTFFKQTRVLTFSLNTCFIQCTFKVTFATSWKKYWMLVKERHSQVDSYAQHILYMGLLHILWGMSKQHGDLFLCIPHWHHMQSRYMDLDIFLEYMRGDLDIHHHACIQGVQL